MAERAGNRVVTSMRGEKVDFDLQEIKDQMANTPSSEDIKQRERFIDLKKKRGTRRNLKTMLEEQANSRASVKAALERQALNVEQSEVEQVEESVPETEVTARKINRKS